MTDNELKEIREKISCPQLGDEHYGEWGILTQRQRFTIKRMLDYIEAQETFINRQKAEIETSQKAIKVLEIMNDNQKAEIKRLKESRDRWRKIAEDFDRFSREEERMLENDKERT